MPGDMSVFDPDEHINWDEWKNVAGPKMKGKKKPKYDNYSTKSKKVSQEKLGLEDRAYQEEGFQSDGDHYEKVRPGSGKGVND